MGGLPAGAGRKNPQKTIFIIRVLLGGRLISIALSSIARRLAYCQGRQLFPSSSCCVVSEDSNHSQSLVSPFLAPRRHRSDGVAHPQTTVRCPSYGTKLPIRPSRGLTSVLATGIYPSQRPHTALSLQPCCYLQTLPGPQLTPEQARACSWSTGTSSRSASPDLSPRT